MRGVLGKVMHTVRLKATWEYLLIFGSDNSCLGAGAPLVALKGQQAAHQGVQSTSQHAAHQAAIGSAH